MKKLEYESCFLDIIYFFTKDVITTSSEGKEDFDVILSEEEN